MFHCGQADAVSCPCHERNFSVQVHPLQTGSLRLQKQASLLPCGLKIRLVTVNL
jgi:hypothetical protein